MDFKQRALVWIMRKFSFISVLIAFILGILFTILEYPIIAPLEDSSILFLIALNIIIVLLIIFNIKLLRKK